MVNHVQVSRKKGREFFYRGKKKVEKPAANKDSMSFHWLKCDGFLMAELLPGKTRKSVFLISGSAFIFLLLP